MMFKFSFYFSLYFSLNYFYSFQSFSMYFQSFICFIFYHNFFFYFYLILFTFFNAYLIIIICINILFKINYNNIFHIICSKKSKKRPKLFFIRFLHSIIIFKLNFLNNNLANIVFNFGFQYNNQIYKNT